ncbi:MAG: DUF4388 domain-containing protein [Anaerolineales bacterium]|nr:DUF4388 domain-containing protein [Anaerolineales bacterium]
MALKGNLHDFSITQLLNLINLAKKTGCLIIEGNHAARLYFREGKLAYARVGEEDDSLPAILHKANRLSAAHLRAIKERAGEMRDKELGLLLINANYLSQQAILESLQTHYVGVVHRLFTWSEGFFRFEMDSLPPGDKIALRINLENIILEGTRKLRELEQLLDEIPSLDIALKFAERPGANIRNMHLNPDEWRVVSFISPKNTLKQIARATRLSDLEMRKVVYGLLQAGLVEFVRVPVAPGFARPVASGLPQTSKEEQKSLINRIIQRVRSI